MQPPPLLQSRSAPARLGLLLVAPAVFGAVTGVALSLSAIAYLILNVLAALGGVAGGLEHEGPGQGAIRGLLGGLLFGAFILLLHLLVGGPPQAALPEPPIVLVGITTAAGGLLGALGGLIRRTRWGRTAQG